MLQKGFILDNLARAIRRIFIEFNVKNKKVSVWALPVKGEGTLWASSESELAYNIVRLKAPV